MKMAAWQAMGIVLKRRFETAHGSRTKMESDVRIAKPPISQPAFGSARKNRQEKSAKFASVITGGIVVHWRFTVCAKRHTLV
jgi:hypothetical protein